MAKLTFVLEDGQEVVVPLKEHITIGRDEDNDIVVDDERLSSHHAEIVQNADGSLQIFDLRSSAGTFVNGESQFSCTLLHGDTIAFGPLVGTLDLEHPATAAPIAVETAPTPPPASPPPAPPDTAHAESVAKLEAEKTRLKAEVAAVEKELRDWQQRAEKERAMHHARVESLRAEEAQLAPAKSAVKQAETAHHDWMEAISALSGQHENKTAALERLNSQHYEKSTEVQRLATAAIEARQETENLTTQKDEATARLKQVRDECEQDEALLNSLRQQIIEHEKRIVDEEAKHAALSTSSTALSAKQQRDEASVKDLESLLITLEQSAAAAEGSLQRVQEDLASHEKDLAARSAELAVREKDLAARNAELAASETSLATCSAALAVETKRLAEARSQRAGLEQQSQSLTGADQRLAEAAQRLAEARAERAELEQQNQELAGTKQQLADARQRLAAVEQRHRDAQANGAQIAPPKRSTTPEDTPSAPTPSDAQLEAARHELAELEAKIAALRQLPSALEGEASQDAATFPPPLIVHVETIQLAPIKIKSERTRGPGTKKAADNS